MSTIEVDEQRIKILEKAIGEYRRFFQSKNNFEKSLILFNHQFRSFYFVDAPPWRILLRQRNIENRVAPDFWLTGAVRSGTSALSNYIFQHPAVVLPFSKELSMTLYKLDYLKAQFPQQKSMDEISAKFSHAMTGHATPSAPAPNMMYFNKKLNPEMKVVLILRNPVDRTISHWRWDLMKTEYLKHDELWKYMPDFEQAMRIEMSEVPEGGCGLALASGSGGTSYLRHSIYKPSLETLIKEFGRDKIHIVEAGDFFNNTNKVVNGVYEFLGLPECEAKEIQEKNHSPSIDIRNSTREQLSEFFKPYNEQLFELLGREFDW